MDERLPRSSRLAERLVEEAREVRALEQDDGRVVRRVEHERRRSVGREVEHPVVAASVVRDRESRREDVRDLDVEARAREVDRAQRAAVDASRALERHTQVGRERNAELRLERVDLVSRRRRAKTQPGMLGARALDDLDRIHQPRSTLTLADAKLEACPPVEQIEVRRLDAEEIRAHLDGLAAVLADCVEGGASVSYMAPFSHEQAREAFEAFGAEVETGRRVILAAFADDELVGTVQLNLATPPNQPHRAEIAKLLVRRSARRRGVAQRLMERAERRRSRRGRRCSCSTP